MLLSACTIGCQNWCDHWKQCVWFIPKKGLSLLKDEEVNLLAVHTDTSISYEMKTLSQNLKLGRSELSTQKYQITLPPEKIALYSDVSWRCSMLNAIKNAVSYHIYPLGPPAKRIFVHVHSLSIVPYNWTLWTLTWTLKMETCSDVCNPCWLTVPLFAFDEPKPICVQMLPAYW